MDDTFKAKKAAMLARMEKDRLERITEEAEFAELEVLVAIRNAEVAAEQLAEYNARPAEVKYVSSEVLFDRYCAARERNRPEWRD